MIGVYYYPEQWPENQWQRDIKNIRQMGMQHIHLAEFAWSRLEPEQGSYNFDWLDKTIAIAKDNGLDVILCTPTATPPVWMTTTHPDTIMVKQNGRRADHGSRAHRCVNSSTFNKLAENISIKMAQRYGKRTNVCGWQLDNEIGHYDDGPCYCSSCAAEFRRYLQKRYRDIDTLNHAWAGDFWSQKYQDFSQIQLPNRQTLCYSINEHALLDFKRFFSISLARFLTRQSKIIRPYLQTGAFITHNFISDDPHHYPAHVAAGLDLYSLTSYPVTGHYKGSKNRQLHRIGDPYAIAYNHDKMRNYNGRWGIMEQQPGQVNWGPANLRPWPGSTRLWLWTAIAHGAELLDTYRYRQPLSGAEQYHKGLTALDGTTLSRGGADFVTVAKEINRWAGHLETSPSVPQPKAAILMDWDSLTALSIHPQSNFFDAKKSHLRYYTGLKKLGLDVDVLKMPTTVNLSRYAVVCTGLTDLVDDQTIAAWARYVENGGHLIVTLRTATRDKNGHFPEMLYGQRLTELTGAAITGYDVLPPEHAGTIRLAASGEEISWSRWAEQYSPPSDATILAKFTDQFYAGTPAAFTKSNAGGRITCIGFDQRQGIEKLIACALHNEIDGLQELPENTLFRIRGSLGIFLNYNDTRVEIPARLYKDATIISGSQITEAVDVSIIQYKS